jgi:polyisoprenoid-binding protein YceI
MGWRFDPDHSQVEWACRYLGLSVIKGAFNRVTAEVHVDDPDPAKWSMSVDIDPASLISAGFARREEALKGENFLETERFPELRFRSEEVSRHGDKLDIRGELLLHGVSRQVTFSGRDNGEAIDRRGLRRRGFSGTTTLRRSDYGIPATGPTFVAEDVDIAVEVQLIWED